LIRKVKATINKSSAVLFNPQSSNLEKIRAVYQMVKLTPVILKELPEPTIKNTNTKEAHILIGTRDKFFKHLRLPSRVDFLRAFVNLFIMIVDTDLYRPFISWWVWEIKKSDWPPLGPRQPDSHHWDNMVE